MKITRTDLAMHADQTAVTRTQQSEKLRVWRNDPAVLTDISEHAWNTLMAVLDHKNPPVPPAPTFGDAGAAMAVQQAGTTIDNDPFLSLVKRMIEKLTGREVKVFDMEAFSSEIRHIDIESQQVRESIPATANPTRSNAGWGIEYEQHRLHEELEQTAFSAAGVVRTTDGQEIEFRLDLEMTRTYREESHTRLQAGDAVRKDPLVVNFDGTAVQLAEQAGRRFRFDLDGDGQKEDLPLFTSGSGYLAMDLNHNGIIDSGKELFGPASGNGFADLARLDRDGNGWIDESDPRFAELLVWTPAAEGDGALRALADVGIGAIGLAHVASPFALRGSDNRDLGLVKSSGLYLTESGKAGSVQEIDLTV
jgi:hypothetical protein